MDLIHWSLNAIDTIFLTRSLGSGEPDCPAGTVVYFCFVFKVEYPIGNGDDTALNGIRLHCNVLKNDDFCVCVFFFFSWGRWTDIKWCPSGFLTAFKLKVEVPQGNGDDTAANNILFRCSQGSLLTGDGTRWGTWGGWSQTCQGKGICGIKTRVERPQGSGDDTALNDASMFCCD
uniref:Uncharacterized protein n=1 Tax=Cyprinus carpio TaxID=7962 RepID=A0A8C1WSW0_CYPCA